MQTVNRSAAPPHRVGPRSAWPAPMPIVAIAPATMDVGCRAASGGAFCNGHALLCDGEEHEFDGPGLYLANLVVD